MSRREEFKQMFGNGADTAKLVQKLLWDDLRDEFAQLLIDRYDEVRPPSVLEALEAFDDAVTHLKGQT